MYKTLRAKTVCRCNVKLVHREKFPEELAGDHMSGPLWFGAECLAAGSSVLNRENQSDELRPHGIKSLSPSLCLCLSLSVSFFLFPLFLSVRLSLYNSFPLYFSNSHTFHLCTYFFFLSVVLPLLQKDSFLILSNFIIIFFIPASKIPLISITHSHLATIIFVISPTLYT